MPDVPQAWIVTPEAIYVASATPPTDLKEGAWPTPLSPLASLIFGVWQLHRTERSKAKAILRNPIFTYQSKLSLFEWGLVKVGAKRVRLSASWPPEDPELAKLPLVPIGFDLDSALSVALNPPTVNELFAPPPSDIARWCLGTEEITSPSSIEKSAGREVRACLWTQEESSPVLSRNRPDVHPLFHAEFLALHRALRRTKQPLGFETELWVSLKPCKMCASLLWEFTLDPQTLKVFYRDFDPGRNARSTCLDPRSAERKTFTPPALWDLPLETQVELDDPKLDLKQVEPRRNPLES